MRILIPATEFPPFPGGVSTLAYEQATGLVRLGHSVRVETLDFSQFGARPDPGGCEVIARPIRTRAIVRLVPLFNALWCSSEQFRPNVIHCPQYRGYGLPTATVARLRGVPYTLYVHGTDIRTEMSNPARRAAARYVLDHARVIATNSFNTARMLKEFFPHLATPLQPLHPGVHANRFAGDDVAQAGAHLRQQWLAEFVRRGALAEDAVATAVLGLAMCRMSRQKGIDVLIEALRLLSEQGAVPHLMLVLAGTGPDLDAFKGAAQRTGVARRVLFTGPVAYPDTPAYYRAADLYVQPSQPVGDFLESFGISFLEAQASGLPCIGSKWGGVPEAVREGETACLVPPGDSAAVAAALRDLAGDPNRRKAMGTRAMAHARTFSWEAHCQQLAEFLAGVAA